MQEHLPGRLGNPENTYLTDSRSDPRIVAAMTAAGELAANIEPVGADASYAECLAYCQAFEESAAAANPLLMQMMPDYSDIEQSTETIDGVDGNAIQLFIHKPKNANGTLPCLVHTHGGGMVLMSAQDPGFVRWRNDLARTGMVVVGVEFRNGGGALGNHPFPAGLNDCASAVQWTHSQAEQLGISSIVVSGESGGGNLAIATTLKAKQEGWADQIDGVYACCPYISGVYAAPTPELVSLRENDGYTLDCEMMSAMVKVYDPEAQHGANPLAWPLQADVSDLSGLPPHIISVNELDPLRDEGLLFYRNLLAAGVSVVARTVHGTPHAGDLMFPDVVPEVYAASLRSVSGFCHSLSG
ncbi:MAG: alpha/beta hydrolase fold domain-containing protein [Pseudomonadota bacterium]